MIKQNQGLFHVIEDAFAILLSRGVYKQAKLYRRGNQLFAQHGGGFIRLTQHGTSAPNVSVDSIEADIKTKVGSSGRLMIEAPK